MSVNHHHIQTDNSSIHGDNRVDGNVQTTNNIPTTNPAQTQPSLVVAPLTMNPTANPLMNTMLNPMMNPLVNPMMNPMAHFMLNQTNPMLQSYALQSLAASASLNQAQQTPQSMLNGPAPNPSPRPDNAAKPAATSKADGKVDAKQRTLDSWMNKGAQSAVPTKPAPLLNGVSVPDTNTNFHFIPTKVDEKQSYEWQNQTKQKKKSDRTVRQSQDEFKVNLMDFYGHNRKSNLSAAKKGGGAKRGGSKQGGSRRGSSKDGGHKSNGSTNSTSKSGSSGRRPIWRAGGRFRRG